MATGGIAANITAKGRQAKAAAGSALWLGRTASQWLIKPFTQNICPVCNNFDPRGHPTSSDKVWGFMEDSEGGPQERAKLYDGRVWLDLNYELKSVTDRAVSSRPCEYCIALVKIIKFLVPDWLTENDESKISIIDFHFLEGACPVVGLRSSSSNFKLSFELFRDADCPPRSWTKLPSLPLSRNRWDRSSQLPVWQFIHEAFKTCLKEHPNCEKLSFLPIPRELPKRLIFIGEEDDEIRLCETTSPGVLQYAALSYSWGGRTAIQTKRSNVDQLRQSIPWSELGAVFQDCVTSARHLSLKYIWIDALCIMQDDHDDWEAESARMGDVYKNAFVTFIAASSSNVDEPFLAVRKREWKANSVVALKEPDGTDSHVRFRRLATTRGMLKYGPSEAKFAHNLTSSWSGAVYSRGWCYQEAIVSRRNLHFTDGAVVWECETVRRAEDELPPYTSTAPLHQPSSIVKFGHPWSQVSWLNAVSAYSQRQLSHDTDVLPAISGVAAQFASVTTGRYLAGLWESHLLHDLTWNRAREGSGRVARSYVAPSWSWASVRDRVHFNIWDVTKSCASIVSASTILAGRNPYGHVSGGEIVLSARLIPVFVAVTDDGVLGLKVKNEAVVKDVSLHMDCPTHVAMALHENGKPEETLCRGPVAQPGSSAANQRQETIQRDRPVRVHVVPLFSASGFGIVSLLLGRSTSVPGAFQRLGVCFRVPERWLSRVSKVNITIV